MPDWLNNYKAKLKEAERILHDCETLLRENGIDCPIQQPPVAPKDKIWLPSGYIRTANHFRRAYQLPPSIHDLSTRNNIAYALQFTDFLSYIVGRFNLGDFTVGNVFYRTATAHVVSIIESILCGLVKTVHDHCIRNRAVCNKASSCDYYLKSPNKYNFLQLLDAIANHGIYQFSDADKATLLELKGIRDRFHMWDTGTSDFHDDQFDVRNYNKAMVALHQVRDEVINAFRTRQAQQVFGCSKDTPQPA